MRYEVRMEIAPASFRGDKKPDASSLCDRARGPAILPDRAVTANEGVFEHFRMAALGCDC